MFKKKKPTVVIDYALGIAKENYAKAVADFNSRAKQAYDALERKEYYFIEDRGNCYGIYHRVFRPRKTQETTYLNVEGYNILTNSLAEATTTPLSDYKQVGNLHDTMQSAENALDRRVDPNKYRTFYEATPPLTEFKK